MGLTGLDIFKLLPKTNCKKCGFPTCLAFAMQVAQKKIEVTQCPDLSDEAKAQLEGAAAPPMRLVEIGAGEKKLAIGQETVLFRHEEKFQHPCGVAVTLSDELDEAGAKERLDRLNKLKFVRVGQEIQIDLVAVVNKSGDGEAFQRTVRLASEGTDLLLLLSSESADTMKAAVGEVAAKRPLIHAATPENAEAMAAVAKENNCPLAVRAGSPEELADLAEKVKGAGVEDIVLDVGSEPLEALQNLTKTRRAALKRNFRALGYPTMVFVEEEDAYLQALLGVTFAAKYAGIVVVNACEPWQILPILTARMNVYTDPQKPIQVEPGLYTVGEPNENSPLMFTTNFSLTYFSVESDVEASRVASHILVVDTEGTSVLTAYSGDKLNEKIVAKAMKDFKAEEVVKHRKLIIPGYVAVMSGALEEETGWEILVGPKESSVLPTYLKQVWSTG